MSNPVGLTRHLQDLESPVRRWLIGQFPNLRAYLKELRKDLPGPASPTIRPDGPVPWTTIGVAFDYRLRYYFAGTPPRELVAWCGAALTLEQYMLAEDPDHPALWREPAEASGFQVSGLPDLDDPAVSDTLPVAFFRHLDRLIAELAPAGRRLAPDDEEHLDRACVALELFDEVFRALLQPGSPLIRLNSGSRVDELLDIAQLAWLTDLAALSYGFYERFADHLADPVALNPTFTGSPDVGGADADLILDGCLLEIKATVTPKLYQAWLLQLLGYALLDYDDAYRIDRLGIYLARQCHLMTWPLKTVLDGIAGPGRASLTDLRGEFRRVASARRRGAAGGRGACRVRARP